jgi:putative tricarboxylic transport membrane protein
MKIDDAITGVLLGIFSVAVFIAALSFPPIPGQSFGASLFPLSISVGMFICAICLVVQGYRQRAQGYRMTVPAWLHDKAAIMRFLLVPATLVFYFEVADYLGFFITATLILVVLFRAFAVRWLTSVVVAIAGALVIHAMFYGILKVPLPWGILEFLAW